MRERHKCTIFSTTDEFLLSVEGRVRIFDKSGFKSTHEFNNRVICSRPICTGPIFTGLNCPRPIFQDPFVRDSFIWDPFVRDQFVRGSICPWTLKLVLASFAAS